MSEAQLQADEVLVEDFLPRVMDEVEALRRREHYPSLDLAFRHWAIKQISPQVGESTIRRSIDSSAKGSNVTSWADPRARSPDGGEGAKLVAHFEWLTEAVDSSSVQTRAREVHFDDAEDAQYPTVRFHVLSNLVDSQHPVKNVMWSRGETAQLLDLRALYNLFLLRLETYDLPPPSKILLRCVGGFAVPERVPGKAIVLEVPLKQIHELVGEHQLSLFARNLRVPISKSKYNLGIQRVIEDPEEAANFWYYNNGMTAVCDELSYEVGPDGQPIVQVQGLQIVNGCQTAMTIYNEGQRMLRMEQNLQPLERSTVMIRVIELFGTESEKSSLGQRIARYTNSQTPITGRDLRATDAEQAKFKQDCHLEWRIFWEAKRDEWSRRLDQNKSYKQIFDWPHVISNEKAGQAALAFWHGRPAFAKSHRRQLFDDEAIYRSVFSIGTPTQALLIPYFFQQYLDEWRKKNNYAKRHTGPGRTHRISKREVMKHGEFFILAMIGQSYHALLGSSDLSKIDRQVLRNAATNVRRINKAFGGAYGSLRSLARGLDKAFETALDICFAHCKPICEADEGMTVRNILVKDTTWSAIRSDNQDNIERLLEPVRLIINREVG